MCICWKFIFISALESSSYVITHSGDISVNSVNIVNVKNVMIYPSQEKNIILWFIACKLLNSASRIYLLGVNSAIVFISYILIVSLWGNLKI